MSLHKINSVVRTIHKDFIMKVPYLHIS